MLGKQLIRKTGNRQGNPLLEGPGSNLVVSITCPKYAEAEPKALLLMVFIETSGDAAPAPEGA